MFPTSRAPADDDAVSQRTVVVSALRADGENLVAPADQNHILVTRAAGYRHAVPDILKSNAAIAVAAASGIIDQDRGQSGCGRVGILRDNHSAAD